MRLSAAAHCPGGGYSPVTIRVNGRPVVSKYDPASSHGGSHGIVTDTWKFAGRKGSNTLEFVSVEQCTHYWIRGIEVRGR